MPHSSPKRTKSSTAPAAAAATAAATAAAVQQPLLPGLPDQLAHLCLSLVPAKLLYSICRRWRRLIYSPSFPPFLSLYALLSNPHIHDITFYCYDPIAGSWSPLPSPPSRHLLLRHPSFIGRDLPIQSVAASGQLVLLAATTHCLLPALPRPSVFDPATSQWRLGPKFHSPRRWCAAGSDGGCIYVASGVGIGYNAVVARSAERWDLHAKEAEWKPLTPLKDGRFSREAVGAVAARGKLHMVSLQGGSGPRDGAVYDVKSDRWEAMPPGMLSGWTGPAAPAAEKGLLYTVEEARGALKVYDWKRDCWRTVATSEKLKGVVAVTAGGERVCVACGGGNAVVVVDVAARGGRRMWVVEPPAGKRVLALHVIPRMSCSDSS